ncbi:hypothetical protein Psch_03506 [Pelotomaculum schinkii]|uniref:Uncharacterized protein n=1 Tax=Pelotomaculum schinkii TaxID=78350 RepID=A0A4Y7R717_9FIRM|nr:hypothetical protein [Pelotomaculum schinkii]TEB04744.1 hypothetical protein Psch_03506 [Pelotomaculum schinkii]
MQANVCAPEEGFSANKKKGEAWCPYCAGKLPFGWDSVLKTARCTGCKCSVKDFYFRKYNDLWGESSINAFICAVKKSGLKVNS